MLPGHSAENETRIVPIGQKWSLVRRTRAGYRGTAPSEITSQRRFVGDCATSQRRANVAESEGNMESEFIFMAYGIALVFCGVVSILAAMEDLR